MLELVDGISRRQLLTDNYAIIHNYNGKDELDVTISINDPLYKYIREESTLYETSEGEYYIVRYIDAGQTDVQITAELDLDDWRAQMLINYSVRGSAAVHLSGVLPDGWEIIDTVGSTRSRTITFQDGITPLELAMECEGVFRCALRFSPASKTVSIVYPQTEQDSGVRVSGARNLRGQSEFRGKSTDLITRLYPRGRDGLTIADVNGGVEYLEDYTYTDKLICGFWQDDSITSSSDLLEDAKELLAERSMPSREWSATIIDLYRLDPAANADVEIRLYSVVTVDDSARGISTRAQVTSETIYPHAPIKNEFVIASNYVPAILPTPASSELSTGVLGQMVLGNRV